MEQPKFGEQVRSRRKALGLSQEQVAYRVGLEQSNLSRIERGKAAPSAEVKRRLDEVLGLGERGSLET